MVVKTIRNRLVGGGGGGGMGRGWWECMGNSVVVTVLASHQCGVGLILAPGFS